MPPQKNPSSLEQRWERIRYLLERIRIGKRDFEDSSKDEVLDAIDELKHSGHLGNKILDGSNLEGADLSGIVLWGISLMGANLTNSNLRGAYLRRSDFWDAKLVNVDAYRANFGETNLYNADLSFANMEKANLQSATLVKTHLQDTNLRGSDFTETTLLQADLNGADLSDAIFYHTVLADVDLTGVIGLESVVHQGPSYIDYVTLYNSWPLPITFLKGCGVPDNLITFLPSLVASEGRLLATFISYSHRDTRFTETLHLALENAGVRVWRDEDHLKIGQKIFRTLSHAIREHNRLILICSKDSLQSEWVNREVTAALEYEMELQKQDKDQYVVMPITIDDYIFTKDCDFDWAPELRARLIGDFQKWEDPVEFQKSLNLLVRSLQLA